LRRGKGVVKKPTEEPKEKTQCDTKACNRRLLQRQVRFKTVESRREKRGGEIVLSRLRSEGMPGCQRQPIERSFFGAGTIRTSTELRDSDKCNTPNPWTWEVKTRTRGDVGGRRKVANGRSILGTMKPSTIIFVHERKKKDNGEVPKLTNPSWGEKTALRLKFIRGGGSQ